MKDQTLHQIKNELHQIIGYAELLKNNSERCQEYSDFIKQSSYKIDVLTRDLIETDSYSITSTLKDESSLLDTDILNGMNIMIVDDIEANRDKLEYIFLTFKSNVKSAKSGNDAIELYKVFKPDIVFMDMVMPDMSGDETATILKSLGSTAKFVAVSALNDCSQKNIDIFDRWLQKPFTTNEILNIIPSLFSDATDNDNNDLYFSKIDADDITQEDKDSIIDCIDKGAISKLEYILDNLPQSNSQILLKYYFSTLSLQNIKNLILSA